MTEYTGLVTEFVVLCSNPVLEICRKYAKTQYLSKSDIDRISLDSKINVLTLTIVYIQFDVCVWG